MSRAESHGMSRWRSGISIADTKIHKAVTGVTSEA